MIGRRYLPAILLMSLGLSGCSVFTPPPPVTYDYRIANQVHPDAAADLGPHPDTADPAITQDPITRKGDPLTTSDSLTITGNLAGDDPLTRNVSDGSVKTNRPIDNWYWIRGTISGGSVNIKVNGISIGRFSVKVDTEISDDLQKGSNDITFDSEPTVPDEPVQADLNVVYAQQSSGDPPVLTYNTTSYGEEPTFTLPDYSKGKSKAIPGLPMPSANPASSPVNADGETEQTLSFIAS